MNAARSLVVIAGISLAGCAWIQPAAEPVAVEATPTAAAAAEAAPAVDSEAFDREAKSRPESLEVEPLESPAIALLVDQSQTAVKAGELAQASILLERGLRIEPYNPRLWQRLAEVRLAQQRFIEAEEMAMRSYGQSARVGELCRRNWLTLRETRRALGDPSEADKAATRAEECVLAPPPRF